MWDYRDGRLDHYERPSPSYAPGPAGPWRHDGFPPPIPRQQWQQPFEGYQNMSWESSLGQLAAGVINGTNPAAAGSVISGLMGNRSYAQAATDQLNNLQMALMMTPPNQVGVMLSLQSLTTMSTNNQLPAGVAPQLALLANPAIQANPVAVQQAIAAIRTLLNH